MPDRQRVTAVHMPDEYARFAWCVPYAHLQLLQCARWKASWVQLDAINDRFSEAREEISIAQDDAETTYFNESHAEAKKVRICCGCTLPHSSPQNGCTYSCPFHGGSQCTASTPRSCAEVVSAVVM